ncbi:WD40 repeat-containing protein [Plasmopara halstedii]|uniref:WD40 repeat-containing protein n=1 Tax=Plasmopara halstedii TaxID=4781 RepID=A0A0P1AMJ5_PLAHL|nr:WD40 repeat-containing protein [Plasmopara halstedii]CEG42607.1 WD40 repeat-containing protein [Plasmopara halstedii]|eukprot:XP_024578976.1 WD40 repeat-containing protein [Plasmopara halstedii]
MTVPRTKKRTTTVFSRDEIGVEQLQSLKEKFADGDLTEKEFVSLFREIVDASLSETQLTELFQKIDANSDGTVDWDELTNYMFLSGSGSDEYRGDDGCFYCETAHPKSFKGEHGSSLGSISSSSATEIMGNMTGKSGGALTLGLLPHHKDSVTRIVRLERPNVYLTTSKDGSVRTWSANSLLPQQVLASGRGWLTDCCVMKRSKRLAVASMNRTLGFYDLNSGQHIGDLVDYSQRQCIPLCLAYVEKPSDDREAIVVGDDTGGISILTCSEQWLSCDGRSFPTVHVSSSSHNSRNGRTGVSPGSPSLSCPLGTPSGPLSTPGVVSADQTSSTMSASAPTMISTGGSRPAGSAMLETQGFSSRVKLQKHTDWVTRVKWVNDMRAIVATSLDKTVSILDVDRLVVKFEYTRHRKGVFDLTWCASTRLIASCGMERDIHVWNPYSSQRAVATLKGHTSSVLHLVSDDEKFQIVSAAADNTIKVWDVRNHRCLQTFVARGGDAMSGAEAAATTMSQYSRFGSEVSISSENQVSALLFDGKKSCLLTGTTQLTRWTVKGSEADTQEMEDLDKSLDASFSFATKSRLRVGALVERPVRLACYNTVFHQVVTATLDADSVIKTWSAETGEEISSFAHAHGSDPVTSMAFDHAGRRLLTGSHNGEYLKMWNFSNGALVKQFNKKAPPVMKSLLNTTTPATAGTLASTAPPPDDLAGGVSEPAATVSLPRKRKPRDILLLPASFGMDLEGRRGNAALMAQSELPSPTRMRLECGQDHPTPVPPSKPRLWSHFGRSNDNSHKCAQRLSTANPGDRKLRLTRVSTPQYRQHEVTNIIDIERNLRVGMGNYTCQRFVCCVGWDRQLFVWADKSGESEALPLHQIPSDGDAENENEFNEVDRHRRRHHKRLHHVMDVLALAYVPPAYVATAGLDGLVLLWSLNSGELVAPLHQNAGPIEVILYADKLQILFVAGERGILFCFDRSMATQGEILLKASSQITESTKQTENCEPITVLRCDKANTHLVSGDAAGCIKIWELRIAQNHEGIELALVCTWRLGNALTGAATPLNRRVLCADIVDYSTRVDELFVLFSCADGEVSLWTLDGVKVGSFGGRHRTWQLGRPATYAFPESRCDWEWLPKRRRSDVPVDRSTINHEEVETPGYLNNYKEFVKEKALNDALQPPTSVFIKNCAIRALNGSCLEPRETFLLEETMPKSGEVWMCVSSYRPRATAPNASEKHEKHVIEIGDGTMQRRQRNLTLSTVSNAAIMSRRSSPLGSSNNVGEPQALSNTSYLHHKLADVHGEITDLITVVKVTRGEIFYWDSAADKPLSVLKALEISNFVRKGEWTRHSLFSHFIGRTFLEDSSCFRVTAVAMRSSDPIRPEAKMFMLIDSDGKERKIQPLNEAVSSVRLKIYESSQNERAQRASNQTRNVVDRSKFSESSTPEVASISGTGARTLPFVQPREKRLMGGLLPKRSSARNRLDPTADIRRIHNPDNIPKGFHAMLHRKSEKTRGNFEGILPAS